MENKSNYKIKNYVIRDKFLSDLCNKGIKKYPELAKDFPLVKGKVKDFDTLYMLVRAAEKKKILYKRSDRNNNYLALRHRLKWYLARLERQGIIKGFAGKVGRPRGSIKAELKYLKEIEKIFSD